jgi:hypothetical protein
MWPTGLQFRLPTKSVAGYCPPFTRHRLTQYFLVQCLFIACSPAIADDWVSDQGISYWCGGIGDESLAQIKSAEGSADAQLVLTAGSDGNYLSDVKLSVSSADKKLATSWQAAGPICLLRLPAGSFTVDANHGAEHRSARLTKRAAGAGKLQPLVINFKPE